ncbi:hypothetical protein F4678DRAFT_464422 [Xylaria arbuscula]|nr:hypothetical protein F4678DRAFT_464422 [Xylaria arbuscula]
MEARSSEKSSYVVGVDFTNWVVIALIIFSSILFIGIIALIINCCYQRRQRKQREQRQSQVDVELGEPNEQNHSRQSLESVYPAPTGSITNNAQPQPATKNGQNMSQEFEEISLSNSSIDVIHTAHAVPITQIQRAKVVTNAESTPSSPGDQVQSPKFYTLQTVGVTNSKKVTPPSTSENQGEETAPVKQ